MSYRVAFPYAEVYIETGFGAGESLTHAITQQPFEAFHSLEIDADRAAIGRALFIGDPRVTIHTGDSAALLATVFDPRRASLAGVYSGNETHDRAICGAPVLEELDAIFGALTLGDRLPIILIDDAVLFVPEWREHETSRLDCRSRTRSARPSPSTDRSASATSSSG